MGEIQKLTKKINKLRNSGKVGELISELNNLATAFMYEDKHDKAETSLDESVELAKSIYVKDSSEYLQHLSQVASVYNQIGKSDRVEYLIDEVLEVGRKTKKDLELAQFLTPIADTYKNISLYEKAKPLYDEILAIEKQNCEKDEGRVWRLLIMAENYREVSGFETAKPLIDEAMEIAKLLFNQESLDFCFLLKNVIGIYKAANKYDEIKSFCEQVLEIYRKVNGTVDPVEALELEGDLIKAVHENNLELLKWTISLGADVNGKDFADRPLLIVAIELNHFDIAKELIRNGANVNVQDEQGRTPLMIVFDTTWDTHIVRDLIENGTDVNIKDANGSNILHFACVTNNQNLEVIKQIISKGVDINSQNNDGYTALICATANLSSDIVKELIANGADVNIAGNDGSTALLTVLIAPVAIATAFDIDYALAAKLTGLASEEITEKLTLEQILEKAINKSTLIFNDLIAAGADVNAKLASGNTTLLNAVSSQNVVAVKTLLAKGVDTKAKNSEGLTALDIAEKNENEEIIELLRNL